MPQRRPVHLPLALGLACTGVAMALVTCHTGLHWAVELALWVLSALVWISVAAVVDSQWPILDVLVAGALAGLLRGVVYTQLSSHCPEEDPEEINFDADDFDHLVTPVALFLGIWFGFIGGVVAQVVVKARRRSKQSAL